MHAAVVQKTEMSPCPMLHGVGSMKAASICYKCQGLVDLPTPTHSRTVPAVLSPVVSGNFSKYCFTASDKKEMDVA